MNKVFIVGRLTKAPEARTTQSGISVTTFTVAVNRRMNREETDFLNVVTWRGLADNCARYLVQGQQVAVAGEIRTRNYEAQDGTRRYVTEIQADDVEFLARPAGAGGGGSYQSQSAPPAGDGAMPAEPAKEGDIFASEMSDVLIDDEELPF